MKEYQFEFWKPRWFKWFMFTYILLLTFLIILSTALPVLISLAFKLSNNSSIVAAAGSSFGFVYLMFIFIPRRMNKISELTSGNETLTFQIAASGLVIKEYNETISWSDFKTYRSDVGSILFDLLVLKLNSGKKYKLILQRFYAKDKNWIEFKEILIRMIKVNNPDAERSYW